MEDLSEVESLVAVRFEEFGQGREVAGVCAPVLSVLIQAGHMFSGISIFHLF